MALTNWGGSWWQEAVVGIAWSRNKSRMILLRSCSCSPGVLSVSSASLKLHRLIRQCSHQNISKTYNVLIFCLSRGGMEKQTLFLPDGVILTVNPEWKSVNQQKALARRTIILWQKIAVADPTIEPARSWRLQSSKSHYLAQFSICFGVMAFKKGYTSPFGSGIVRWSFPRILMIVLLDRAQTKCSKLTILPAKIPPCGTSVDPGVALGMTTMECLRFLGVYQEVSWLLSALNK